MTEPGERLLNRFRLAGAVSLVCPDIQGNIPFRLLNPTDEPVTVFHGATLGQFTPNDFDATPIDPRTTMSCTRLPTTIQQSTPLLTINPLSSTIHRQDSVDQQAPITAPHPQISSTSRATPSDFPDLSKSVLSHPEKQALSELLVEYADVLSHFTTSLGRTNLVQHKIDVGSSPPIRQPPYRAPHTQRQEIENHVSNMLQANLVQPSNSPWSAPIVPVKKKDCSYRFCVDYRKLNSVTRKDSYSIQFHESTML